jgi:prepilin-type N-terminal cleavage/methylation domain-containing protein
MTTLPPFLTDRRGFAARGSRGPAAFTLVELLVVIAILAMLMALLVPTVMRSLAKSRNAAIKAEIDMLHMAIMNYKTEYGSFPPCFDGVAPTNGQVIKHLRRLFPRMENAAPPLPSPALVNSITPRTAIVSWLNGFTDDPTDPLKLLPASADLARRKLYDFDQSRVSDLLYHPSRKPQSPYLYINASNYEALPYTGGTAEGAFLMPPPPPATGPDNRPSDKNLWLTDLMLAAPQEQQFFNPDTFQIICAGADEQFGTGDDLSNFWPETRQDYLDTLK